MATNITEVLNSNNDRKVKFLNDVLGEKWLSDFKQSIRSMFNNIHFKSEIIPGNNIFADRELKIEKNIVELIYEGIKSLNEELKVEQLY